MDGMYEAVWFASWKVGLRIDDDLYIAARDRSNKRARGKIMRLFNEACIAKYGKAPEGRQMNWDDKHFDIKRIGDAPQHEAPDGKLRLQESECPCNFDKCELCNLGDHSRCSNCPRDR